MSAIVVLGSANMDLVVRQPRLPRPGETMFGSSFSTVAGGKGLNQAVAAARAGGEVAFAGAVGADAFGDALRATLVDEGIDVAGLATLETAPTGIAQISVVDGGENSIVVVSGANTVAEHLDEATRAAITGSRFVVAQLERPIGLVREAFAHARERGVTTVLTPAPVQELGDLLGLVDLLLLNAAEACELAGLDDPEAAAVSLSRTVPTVAMTRGADGVLLAVDGELRARVPALRVEPVDTTGAGDTFAGVLVAWLAEGAELEAAVGAAATAGSLAVTRDGASTSMPTRAEITARL